jgi:hypothetical protein
LVAVEPPQVRYARSGDVAIAYQVAGDGPIDLVFIPGEWRLFAARSDDAQSR